MTKIGNKTSVNTLKRKIYQIASREYACEDPFGRKQSPAIGLAIRRFIKKELGAYNTADKNYEIVKDSRGYGFYSCFIKDTLVENQTCIYINVDFAAGTELKDDLGFDSVLYRTAKNAADWTGGSNRYANLSSLISDVVDLYEMINIKEEPVSIKPDIGVSVDSLLAFCQKEHDAGHGDYKIFITDDEEANGYHAMWYIGSTASELEPYREAVEQTNRDLSILPDKDKAIYLG